MSHTVEATGSGMITSSLRSRNLLRKNRRLLSLYCIDDNCICNDIESNLWETLLLPYSLFVTPSCSVSLPTCYSLTRHDTGTWEVVNLIRVLCGGAFGSEGLVLLDEEDPDTPTYEGAEQGESSHRRHC